MDDKTISEEFDKRFHEERNKYLMWVGDQLKDSYPKLNNAQIRNTLQFASDAFVAGGTAANVIADKMHQEIEIMEEDVPHGTIN